MKIDGTRRNDRATELVLAYYAAFNRADWDGMLGLLSEEVVHDLNQGPREVGRAAFAEFLRRRAVHYREQLHEIVVMASPDGKRAAAEYLVRGEYLADDAGLPPARGQSYVLWGGTFFQIHDDRITRMSNHYNLHEWIAQIS
jgi:steroid delta-isomerase-like uncharacterized protein